MYPSRKRRSDGFLLGGCCFRSGDDLSLSKKIDIGLSFSLFPFCLASIDKFYFFNNSCFSRKIDGAREAVLFKVNSGLWREFFPVSKGDDDVVHLNIGAVDIEF